ncbi:MAG TPA: roadblock/LC7 domain-containing protein [Micromonosporaceae bacterium]|nr:roadblock/LC7 domain-containing protein [Micromonosporaceae bacterium]
MTSAATYSSSLNSLLAGMLARTPGTVHAVLATVDGVQVAISAGLPPERASQLATIGAGLLSIADGAGIMMGTGGPQHVIVEMYGGLLLAAPVAPRVVLSLLATHDADRERLGFELAQFACQIGPMVAHIR